MEADEERRDEGRRCPRLGRILSLALFLAFLMTQSRTGLAGTTRHNAALVLFGIIRRNVDSQDHHGRRLFRQGLSRGGRRGGDQVQGPQRRRASCGGRAVCGGRRLHDEQGRGGACSL